MSRKAEGGGNSREWLRQSDDMVCFLRGGVGQGSGNNQHERSAIELAHSYANFRPVQRCKKPKTVGGGIDEVLGLRNRRQVRKNEGEE